MQKILLAGTNLSFSRIGFGTAALHHLGSRADRERLVHAALDHGITHFDTSPYYGHGLAEIALAGLGRAATIATKVGLYPPGGAHGSHTRMLLRKGLGKLLHSLSRPEVDFAVERARRSLHDSLRRLKRERVELLLLHEPRSELVATDEWRRWLAADRDRIGAIGVAGEFARIWPFVHSGSELAAVIQTGATLSAQDFAALSGVRRSAQITYGHLAGRNVEVPISKTLGAALASFPEAVLLLGTRRIERLAEFARAAAAAAVAPQGAVHQPA
ncbi:MAG: aldo/keto reductase [Pseudomonadota bacterium]